MNHWIRRIALAFAALLISAAASAIDDTPRVMAGLKTRAEAFVNAMVTGNGHVVQGELDPKMRRTMNPEAMKVMMGDLLTRGGGLRSVEPATLSVQSDGRVVAMVPMHMKRNSVCSQIVFDRVAPLCKIVGFSILPWDESMRPAPATPADAASAPVPAPSYANPDTFRETHVELPFANGPLKGILALPVTAGETVPVPGAVLLPGMGAFDPDMSVGRTRVFRDIAQGLASKGVAVLRFETIEHAKPTGADAEPAWHDLEDWRLEHARDAVAWLVARPDVQDDNVTVVGHNLGAYVAPIVARDTAAARVALLAPPAVPISAWLGDQARRFVEASPELNPDARATFERVAAAADRLAKGELVDDETVLDCSAVIWKDLQRLNPAEELAASNKSARIFFASADFLVPPASAAAWQAVADAKPHAIKATTIASANHLFVPVESDAATVDNISTPGNASAELVEELAAFAKTGKMPVF